MSFNTPPQNLATALFLTVFLTACGGGGGSDSGSDTVKSEIKPPTATSNKQPKPSNSNDEQAALNANNEFSLARTSCGLSGLSVDSALDSIAIQHARYIKYAFANSSPTVFNAHYENKIENIAHVTGDNNPYFGGFSFSDRLLNANYLNAKYGAAENIAQSIYYSSAGNLVSSDVVAGLMAKSLLAAPYHLRSLMIPSSSLTGTGMVTYKPHGSDTANNQGYVLVNHASATKATKDRTVAGVFTYPCQGVTGTVTALYNETPDPVKHTGRDLRLNPIGQPIYVNVPSAKTISISNVKFHDTQRNIDVPIELLDYRQDPYKNTPNALPANEAFILPTTDNLKSCNIKRNNNQSQQCGLYGNTKYQVSFDVLVDNQRLEQQSFAFTTGKVNY